MYVVTFYSFKGGVGRSMAMMNIAASLVSTGKTVLVVDFDLEAPGLDTFNLPRPIGCKGGVVEFVCEYKRTQKTPDITDHVYESKLTGENFGHLWFMPAGSRDENYGQLLSSINWRDLYERNDGYLLFEDLKSQWKNYIDPDYVFIDSRTGHTDVGGICTRQLPDAVTLLFYPTEQNLLGMSPIVDSIKEENIRRKGYKDPITLHFVTSNVPDLDDEKGILESRLNEFKKSLGYEKLASVIHHYPSLALLNQDIFTIERPSSKLAGEYLELVKCIQKSNPEDLEGSLQYLESALEGANTKVGQLIGDDSAFLTGHNQDRDGDSLIDGILENHGRDLKVLLSVVKLRQKQGRLEEAESILSRALELEPENPQVLVKKSLILDRLGQSDQAIDLALKASKLDDLSLSGVNQVARLLGASNSEYLKNIVEWPSIDRLSSIQIISLSQSLTFERRLLSYAEQLIVKADKRANSEDFSGILGLVLIGENKFSEAIELYTKMIEEEPNSIANRFNYAMARWGLDGEPNKELFEIVHSISEGLKEDPDGPNYLQCMSVVNFVLGDTISAKKYIERARNKLSSTPGIAFSCWSYLNRRFYRFEDDLDEQALMIDGKDISPRFTRKNDND